MSRDEIYLFGFRGFPDLQGGIEAHVEHLATHLVQLGYHVTACVRSPYVDSKVNRDWKGVRLLRLWTVRNSYLETFLHSLVCVLVAGLRRPKVVHVHAVGSALVTPLLRILGLKVVVTHHGEDYNREKWSRLARGVLLAGEMLGMCFAHKRIAISRNIGDLISAKYGKSCEVIPNGVILPDLPVHDDKIVELGLEAGRYVLTVGRLVREKRQLDLLRAFCNARLDGWKLVIVGETDHKSKYADLVVSEAGLAKAVVMAGFQSGEALRQIYAHAGLFVLPSSHEGLPIVLLEALSYGLPVLVSDIPSNLEVVNDPAHTFRMGNVSELSARISALSGLRLSPVEREDLRRRSTHQYDWADIAMRTSAVYDEVIGEKLSTTVARLGKPRGHEEQPAFDAGRAEPVKSPYAPAPATAMPNRRTR